MTDYNPICIVTINPGFRVEHAPIEDADGSTGGAKLRLQGQWVALQLR